MKKSDTQLTTPDSKRGVATMWGRLVTCGGLIIRLVLPQKNIGPIANRPQVTNLPHERRRLYAASIVLVAIAALSSSQPSPREQVGVLANGGFLLNSGWRVKPAGTQLPLDTMPMSSVLTADGRFLIVLNGGYKAPSLSVVDTKSGTELSPTPLA